MTTISLGGDREAAARAIAEVLRGLGRDEFAILAPAGSGRYVQYLRLERELLCEAAGNEYLEDADRLDAGQEATLRAHGWAADGNWWQSLPIVADPEPSVRAGAKLGVDVLLDVFRVAPGSEIGVELGS